MSPLNSGFVRPILGRDERTRERPLRCAPEGAHVSAAADLTRLRGELERRFGSAILPRPGERAAEARAGFRTGVDALDALVPEGIPRGLLTLWTGEATSGRTAALRSTVLAACGRGER